MNMKPLLLNMFLAGVWVVLLGQFTLANILFGLVVGYGLMFLFRNTLVPDTSYFRKVSQAVTFVLYFLWELMISNLRVAKEVLTPGLQMKPGIVAVPLDVTTGFEITLLANLITLTPGTLSLDISDDNKIIYVHTMYVDALDLEAFRDSIKQGFEKQVKEIFE
jgi:multicomponent Na+:H+ antiporter subunit E